MAGFLAENTGFLQKQPDNLLEKNGFFGYNS
jgi:hypothetical protein